MYSSLATMDDHHGHDHDDDRGHKPKSKSASKLKRGQSSEKNERSGRTAPPRWTVRRYHDATDDERVYIYVGKSSHLCVLVSC